MTHMRQTHGCHSWPQNKKQFIQYILLNPKFNNPH